MIERVTVKQYWKVREAINQIGIEEIKRHIRKHHPRAVMMGDIDRQLVMVKSTLANGPVAAAKLFGCAPCTCTNTVTKWYRYALEAIEEKEG